MNIKKRWPFSRSGMIVAMDLAKNKKQTLTLKKRT
jgi:hypothetical protein